LSPASAEADPAALCGLHVLVDDAPGWSRSPVAQARTACQGGAAVVQLRAKNANDRQALAWAREIRAITREAGALFFVNDRFDLALAAGADGVHLGQTDVPPARLPESARSRLRIGRSTHSLDEFQRALAEPVDYIAFGPIFGTTSKHSPHAKPGSSQLAQVVRAAGARPVVAIGGIDVHNAGSVIAAGAAGIAVISAVAGAGDPVGATRALVRRLRGDTS
jgi:thiamine-phosphate diphosphorylase